MLETIINALAYGSLGFAAVAAYLQLNKLWARKHLPDVAESISIPGILVESVPLFFFGIYFLWNGELLGIIDSVIWLLSAVVVTMIGAGFWVRGRRSRGFWSLVRGAISREKSELSTLARELFAPAAAPQLIRLLTLIAAVDGHVDRRERDLIKSFADAWKLDVDWRVSSPDEAGNDRLVDAREAFSDYLDTAPPPEQVAHLLDILSLIIHADDEVAREERVAFGEISGQADAYLAEEQLRAAFAVVIVPQGEPQDEAIRLLLKGVEPRTYAGGKAYRAGEFYSREYADVIRDEYRALGFFTVVMDETAAVAR